MRAAWPAAERSLFAAAAAAASSGLESDPGETGNDEKKVDYCVSVHALPMRDLAISPVSQSP